MFLFLLLPTKQQQTFIIYLICFEIPEADLGIQQTLKNNTCLAPHADKVCAMRKAAFNWIIW